MHHIRKSGKVESKDRSLEAAHPNAVLLEQRDELLHACEAVLYFAWRDPLAFTDLTSIQASAEHFAKFVDVCKRAVARVLADLEAVR